MPWEFQARGQRSAVSRCPFAPRRRVAARLANIRMSCDDAQKAGFIGVVVQQEARKKAFTDDSLLQAQSKHTNLVAFALVSAALKIKHGGFSEEMEWRLIDNVPGLNVVHALGNDPNELIRFRRGAFGVTPYLVAALPQLWRGMPLGIAKVIVGPSSNAVSTVASIRDLLRIKLRSSAAVESCEIPFRAW